MRKLIKFIIFTVVLSGYPGEISAQELNDSVVKIFVTSNSMDYYRPWQSRGIAASAGSGSIIKGNKILTNAHVVSDQTFIQVKKHDDAKKYTARVEAVGFDCDLALLTVDDPEFFKDVAPLEFGDLPQLSDAVKVIGYPAGGGKLSVTEGVVSRIEVTSYTQSARKLLTVQIDAAINPGNSGGPVIKNGKIVGVAMQVYQTGQNIGYMIPTPIINHFFEDLRDGHYDGFPIMGIDFLSTENKTLREFYKITDREGGVVVSKILPFSAAYDILKEGDIILAIDQIPVGEDGTFEFRKGERLTLPYLITKHHVGENLHLKLIRDGKLSEIDINLKDFITLIPHPERFEKPPYYIYGGFVFTALSTDLIKSWGETWWEDAPLNFTYYLIGPGRMNVNNKKEIVVLLNVLSDDINVGYHGYANEVILKVNGEKFSSFEDFVRLIKNVKVNNNYTIFETEQVGNIIIGNKDIDRIDQEIINRNNIPQQYSADVVDWLNE